MLLRVKALDLMMCKMIEGYMGSALTAAAVSSLLALLMQTHSLRPAEVSHFSGTLQPPLKAPLPPPQNSIVCVLDLLPSREAVQPGQVHIYPHYSPFRTRSDP